MSSRARVEHLSLLTLLTLTETVNMHKRLVRFFGFVSVSSVSSDNFLRAREVMFGGVGVALTVDGCISALVDLDYVFSLREDGAVTVKQPAKRNPRAAEMMAYLALHKEEVRAVVQARETVQTQLPVDPGGDMDVIPIKLPEPDAGGWVVLEGVPPMVAFAAGDLINQGKAELIGKVIYRRISNVFDLTYKVLEVGK